MEQKNNLKFTNTLLSKESYILDMDQRSKNFRLIVDDFLMENR